MVMVMVMVMVMTMMVVMMMVMAMVMVMVMVIFKGPRAVYVPLSKDSERCTIHSQHGLIPRFREVYNPLSTQSHVTISNALP